MKHKKMRLTWSRENNKLLAEKKAESEKEINQGYNLYTGPRGTKSLPQQKTLDSNFSRFQNIIFYHILPYFIIFYYFLSYFIIFYIIFKNNQEIRIK